MDIVPEETIATETPSKGPALGYSKSPPNKFSEKRMDNKQRKKRAHKRKIARSNTNG
jgi:hypothetical protein